jgi:hypothetical protein
VGLFNTLIAPANCPVCKKRGIFHVQFKYGFTRQLDFMLGEPLQWSGTENDIGSSGARRVVVEGTAEPCPSCGEDFLEFDILVESDVIVSLTPIGKERPYEDPDGFSVIEP